MVASAASESIIFIVKILRTYCILGVFGPFQPPQPYVRRPAQSQKMRRGSPRSTRGNFWAHHRQVSLLFACVAWPEYMCFEMPIFDHVWCVCAPAYASTESTSLSSDAGGYFMRYYELGTPEVTILARPATARSWRFFLWYLATFLHPLEHVFSLSHVFMTEMCEKGKAGRG